MHGVGLFAAIVVGLLAGWIAARVMNRRHGLLTNLAVGLVGALLAGFLANVLGFVWYGGLGGVAASTLGAALLLLLLGRLRGP